MKHCHYASLVILLAIFFVTGCTFGSNSSGGSGGGSNGSGSGTTGSTGSLATITVSPVPGVNLLVGATQQFTATAKDASGNTLSGVTFIWTSTVTTVVTVNSTGLATAVAPGSAFIVASVGSIISTPSPAVNVATALSVTTAPLPLGAPEHRLHYDRIDELRRTFRRLWPFYLVALERHDFAAGIDSQFDWVHIGHTHYNRDDEFHRQDHRLRNPARLATGGLQHDRGGPEFSL